MYLKALFALLLICTCTNHFVVVAEEGPEKTNIDITWPVNNTFIGNGTEHTYAPESIAFDKEYIELEYIESTGTQYIDTRVLASNDNGFEMTFMISPSQTAWGHLIGGAHAVSSRWRNGITYEYSLRTTPPVSEFKACDSSDTEQIVNHSGFQTGQIYHVSFINSTFTDFNGSVDYRTKNIAATYNYYVFCTNDAGSPVGHISMRLYSLKMYAVNSVIKEFIPVITVIDMPKERNIDGTNSIPKGTVCLYDKTNDKYYLNSGSSNFKAGPFKNGIFEDKVHDFEVIDSINSLPAKYLDSKYVPIHIKSQETNGPQAGYYIYDFSSDTIWGDSDTSGASATSFASGGSPSLLIYKEIDTKKTDPDDYTAKIELVGLGKIYFNIPNNESHDWVIKNRIVPTLEAYNGYYDGLEHGITSYSFKDEDDNDLTGVTINFNTVDDNTYPIDSGNIPKYTNVGTYRLYYQATKQYYKQASGYIDIIITSKPKQTKTKEYVVPNTGIK